MMAGARLLDLSSDLLQRICGSLSTQERECLFSTCKQLAHFGSTDPWCLEQLATLEFDTDPDSLEALSLTRWLQSRLGCLRRLKLANKAENGSQASVPMVLLGALAGAPLVSLAVEVWESATGFSHLDTGSWVRVFPELKHLELAARNLTARLPLSSLTGLTSVSLSLKDPEHYNSARLYMDDHCLPASLRHLYLDGFDALPPAVAKAPQLEQLYISSDPGAMLGSHLSGLAALTELTALRIEGYLLHLPADLTSLHKLKVLDLWCNCLWQDGNAGPESKLLSSLSKLEKLYLHYSTGPEGDIQGLSLKLPSLKVLSLAKIPLASLPELPFGSLEKLELDLDLAVGGCQRFSEMTRLQELRLGLFGQFDGLPEDEKQVVMQQLPLLWRALSQLETLRQVWLCRYAVIDLVGDGHEFAAAEQWAKQMGGAVRVLLGAFMEGKDYFSVKGYYDSGGFHHEFATAWDAVE